MPQFLGLVSIVVHDVDDAIAFYVGKLGFQLKQDLFQPEQNKRWVVVCPPGATETGLLLAKAGDERQSALVGNQTGGRVGFFLYTDDFWRDHQAYTAQGVRFVGPPRTEAYGIVAVFSDLYGNLWDLLQPAQVT